MAKLNQNDWIVIGVASVFGLGVSAYLFFSKPEAKAIPAPAQVNVTKAALPVSGVVMANALPGGSAGGGGMGGRGGMGMAGMPGAGGLSAVPGAQRPGGMPGMPGGGMPGGSGPGRPSFGASSAGAGKTGM